MKTFNNLFAVLFLFSFSMVVNGQAQNNQKTNSYYGTIIGRVTDYITEKPLSNVQIKVFKRIVDILDNGAKSIRPMKDVVDLKTEAKTNNNGEYSITVPLDIEPNYFMVTANIEGYEEMISMFVVVEKNDTVNSKLELAVSFFSTTTK